MQTQSSKPGRTVAELQALSGTVVGVSPWILIDQSRIDGFAEVTEDHQFIHVDPEAAAGGPFGRTIAHGFLYLSLLSYMAKTGLPAVEGVSTSLNYGFDRVRFLTPVPSGARIRGVFMLDGVTPRQGGQALFQYMVEVEIEGSAKPALAAEWLVLTVPENRESA